MNPLFKRIFWGAVVVFAIIGLVFTGVFIGMQFGLFNVRGSIAERNQAIVGTSTPPVIVQPCTDSSKKTCDWNQTPEWAVIKGGLQKDKGVIERVSGETGVPPRMVAAVVVPEQIRFFTANREVFKRYFEPLKILGSMSQFSLGVSGIKQETANTIELNAGSSTSPFYPGPGMDALFAYAQTDNHDAVLFDRLTDEKNHYYSYLYTALYIKEVEAQWKQAGFDISNDPATVVTLFNIGFVRSRPNATPSAGGAIISTGGKSYPYGQLGANFYLSSELEEFAK